MKAQRVGIKKSGGLFGNGFVVVGTRIRTSARGALTFPVPNMAPHQRAVEAYHRGSGVYAVPPTCSLEEGEEDRWPRHAFILIDTTDAELRPGVSAHQRVCAGTPGLWHAQADPTGQGGFAPICLWGLAPGDAVQVWAGESNFVVFNDGVRLHRIQARAWNAVYPDEGVHAYVDGLGEPVLRAE